MFTPGRIAFAIVFAVAFVILMVISYRKDAKNHDIIKMLPKVALYGTIAIVHRLQVSNFGTLLTDSTYGDPREYFCLYQTVKKAQTAGLFLVG